MFRTASSDIQTDYSARWVRECVQRCKRDALVHTSMSLIQSLFELIVNLDGEALVMHAGDVPFVVAPSGRVQVTGADLTLASANEIIHQLLPHEFRRALDEFGAVRYDFPRHNKFPLERFTLSVTGAGDEVWAEIRRRRIPDDDFVPEEFFEPQEPRPERPAGFVSTASD